MRRWNASASTFTLLHFLFTLSSPTFGAAFRLQARHDGKSHKNHIHKGIDAREDIPNAPFTGIGAISNTGATVLPLVPATTPSLSPDDQFETISALAIGAFSGVTVPSLTSMTTASPSSGPAMTNSSTPPVFPITVIQVPIYTICPDTAGYLNVTSTLSSNATALHSNASATSNITRHLPNIVSAIPVSVNATALLSNGSYTTFTRQYLSIPAAASITPAPAANARVILGTNGCQTLYSAFTTQICSTVITRGGQLPISVTECSQLVTFSSSSTSPGPICNCPDTPALPTAPTSPVNQPSSGILIGETVNPALATGGGTSAGLGIAFFAAPWHEIAAGIVPGIVHVANCADDDGKNCSTSSERWSVSTSTSTTTRTRTVQYAGPVIFEQGVSAMTTSVSYSSIQTSTHTILIPTIVRVAIAGITTAPTSSGRVVTVQMTIPQVQTWGLKEQHFTAVVTEVVTITVPGTVRVTHTHTVTMGVGV